MIEVRIDQTFGQIAIDQRRGKISVKTQQPDFDLTIVPNSFTITTDDPAVKIDMQKTRASMGYQTIVPFQKEIAKKGQAIALAGIRRIAREGDRLGSIEDGGTTIASIAKDNSRNKVEFNVALMPAVPPEITASGDIKITSGPGKVDVKFEAGKTEVSLIQKPEVNVYVEVEPQIKIYTVGQWVDFLA